jgi:hypothetical protein
VQNHRIGGLLRVELQLFAESHPNDLRLE